MLLRFLLMILKFINFFCGKSQQFMENFNSELRFECFQCVVEMLLFAEQPKLGKYRRRLGSRSNIWQFMFMRTIIKQQQHILALYTK